MYALILAGGKGERLRPVTDTAPKPMILVHGEPILMHQVRKLRLAGVTDVVFLVGYLANKIEEYFGDGSQFGIRAHYSHEETPLGRGGALKRGLAMVPHSNNPVIAINGDIITDAAVDELLTDYHERCKFDSSHMATILTIPMISPYGIVDMNNTGKVSQFREKAELPYNINGGIYIMNPAIRDFMPDTGDHETTTFPELAALGRISAVRTNEFWCSVDSFQDLNKATIYLAKMTTRSHICPNCYSIIVPQGGCGRILDCDDCEIHYACSSCEVQYCLTKSAPNGGNDA